MRTAGFSSKLIRPVKYIPRIGRERGVLDRKSKGQRNEEGAQNHERHRGGDRERRAAAGAKHVSVVIPVKDGERYNCRLHNGNGWL